MKKYIIWIFLILSIFTQNIYAFDFNDTKAKKYFCEKPEFGENNKYDEKNDTCVKTFKNWEKNIIDFRSFYCSKNDSRLDYSYITEKCLEFWDRFLYKKENLKYPKNIDSKEDYYRELTNNNFDWEYFIEIKNQKKLSKIYKKYLKLVKDKNKEQTKITSEKIIDYIEKKLKTIKNQKVRNALFLLKYEIENNYFRKIYGCKWSYCNSWFKYSESNQKEIEIPLKWAKIIYDIPFWTFGCYDGSVYLEKNSKKKKIFDNFKISKWRNFCPVNVQVVNDTNARIFFCIWWWAGSWECSTMVFNINTENEKLSYIWEWYYIPEYWFDLYALEKYKKKRKWEILDYIKEVKKDLKNKNSQDHDWIKDTIKTNKKIKKYFEEKYNIIIPYLEGDEFLKLVKFL